MAIMPKYRSISRSCRTATFLLVSACFIQGCFSPAEALPVIPTGSQPAQKVTQIGTPTEAPSNPSATVTTPTAEETATSQVTPPTPTPQPRLAVLIQGEVKEEAAGYLLDPDGQIIRIVENLGFGSLTLHPNGCWFMKAYINSFAPEINITITTLDQDGQIVDQQNYPLADSVNTDSTLSYALSPTGEWLAYSLASGEYGMGIIYSEFLDVMVVRLTPGENLTPRQISRRGGGTMSGPLWSPDGSRLAYTDRDPEGIPQVYFFDPLQQQAIQATHLGTNDGINQINGYAWSPDGQQLAISAYHEEVSGESHDVTLGWVGVIDVADSQPRWLIEAMPQLSVSTSQNHIPWMWWNADGTQLFTELRGFGPAEERMIWLDTKTGDILQEIIEDWDQPNPYAGLMPLSGLETFITLGKGYHVYYRSTDQFVDRPEDYIFYNYHNAYFFNLAPLDLTACRENN